MRFPVSGDLLIAPLKIPDSRFHKSVLLLTHDHGGGSFALCVNKHTNHTLQEVLKEADIETMIDFPLYWGGPVSPGTIWMLHSSDWAIDHTVRVNDQWSMTSHLSMFHHIADGDYPEFFRLMFGYCSWAPNQLRAELRGLAPWNPNHSWLIANGPSPEWLYEQPPEDLWINSAELSGHQAIESWL